MNYAFEKAKYLEALLHAELTKIQIDYHSMMIGRGEAAAELQKTDPTKAYVFFTMGTFE